MDATWRILGDGLCIAALAIIATVSRNAWKRIPADTRVPLTWSAGNTAPMRVSKKAALLAMPIAATIILLAPTLFGVTFSPANTAEAILLFSVRALLAALLALFHIVHVSLALALLDREGQLLP